MTICTTSAKLSTFIIFIDTVDTDLIEWYRNAIEIHNKAVKEDEHPNSGFDLATPVNMEFTGIKSTMLVTNIKGKMIGGDDNCSGYYMYPRSSISKTPLMLANHVGIIDSGYRGALMGAFRNLDKGTFKVSKYDRLLQVCQQNLRPFLVYMVKTEEELGQTRRGQGGFGSTGK